MSSVTTSGGPMSPEIISAKSTSGSPEILSVECTSEVNTSPEASIAIKDIGHTVVVHKESGGVPVHTQRLGESHGLFVRNQRRRENPSETRLSGTMSSGTKPMELQFARCTGGPYQSCICRSDELNGLWSSRRNERNLWRLFQRRFHSNY